MALSLVQLLDALQNLGILHGARAEGVNKLALRIVDLDKRLDVTRVESAVELQVRIVELDRGTVLLNESLVSQPESG